MLKLQYKDQRKAAIWLVDTRYVIGSDASNDIVLTEEGIGGFHAELRVEEGDRVFLTDAGSVTGTHVNEKQVKGRTELRAGDLIRIGSIEMELVDPKEQLSEVDASDSATAMTPALQGLSLSEGASDNGQAPASASGTVPQGWLLKGKAGSVAGQSYPMPANGRAVLGRSPNCDMVLPGNHVSRQHAELYFQSGKLHVKDLGSSNGTYLNRKKVSESLVKPGDELRFDTLVFIVEAPEDSNVTVEEEAVDEKTSFRPAVQEAPKPAAKPAAAKPAPEPAPQPAPKPAAQPAPAPAAPQSSGGMGMVIGLLVLVAVAGAAAYFLL